MFNEQPENAIPLEGMEVKPDTPEEAAAAKSLAQRVKEKWTSWLPGGPDEIEPRPDIKAAFKEREIPGPVVPEGSESGYAYQEDGIVQAHNDQAPTVITSTPGQAGKKLSDEAFAAQKAGEAAQLAELRSEFLENGSSPEVERTAESEPRPDIKAAFKEREIPGPVVPEDSAPEDFTEQVADAKPGFDVNESDIPVGRTGAKPPEAERTATVDETLDDERR